MKSSKSTNKNLVKKSPIPVDPYTIFIPQEVIDSNVADDIRYWYYESKKTIPESLTQFLNNNSEENRGREWEINLMKILTGGTVPLDIVEKWVVRLTCHFIRAEIRGWLKKQKSLDGVTVNS